MGKNCEICGKWVEIPHKHHLIGGKGRRAKADRHGLVIEVCPTCHREIHDKPRKYLYLKENAQRELMEREGWDTERFIKEFNKSYI